MFGCLEVGKVRKKIRSYFQKWRDGSIIFQIFLVFISYFLEEGRDGGEIKYFS